MLRYGGSEVALGLTSDRRTGGPSQGAVPSGVQLAPWTGDIRSIPSVDGSGDQDIRVRLI